MPTLFGEYPIKADAKGRFLLPAVLLRQLAPEPAAGAAAGAATQTAAAEQFVMGRGLDPCLVIYPLGVWQAEMGALYARNRFDPDTRTLARLYQSGAQPVELDAQKRLLIPKPLWEELTAGEPSPGELTLIGAHDRIEVWTTARYRQWLSAHLPQLTQLAQRLAPPPATA